MSDEVQQLAREFLALDEQIKKLEKIRDDKKKALSEVARESGEVNEDGHVVLSLDSPINGIKGFQLTRRVTRTLDEPVAEQILTVRGIREKCFRTTEVLDQDSVMHSLRVGELNENEVDRIFPPKVNFAFNKVKE